jgi:hypothetical protein
MMQAQSESGTVALVCAGRCGGAVRQRLEVPVHS